MNIICPFGISVSGYDTQYELLLRTKFDGFDKLINLVVPVTFTCIQKPNKTKFI